MNKAAACIKYSVLTLLLFPVLLFAQTEPFPEPGCYRENIFLSFPGMDENTNYRILVNKETVEHDQWLRYKGPVLLSALPGEERHYTVVIKNGEQYDYRIIRSIPNPPSILIEGEKSLTFEGDNREHDIWYRIVPSSSADPGDYMLWDGGSLSIPFSGEDIVRIEAYTVDPAGNRSRTSLEYRERPYRGASEIPVISPRPGIYHNAQLFFIDTMGYEWVRYTIDDDDPVIRGAPYLSPMIIRSTGVIRLKVAALPVGAASPVRQEIVFAQFPDSTSLEIPESGVYTSALSFELPGTVSAFSLIEDGPINISGRKHVSIKGVDGALSIHPFRFYGDEEQDQDIPLLSQYVSEYRYLYIIDLRRPGAPEISFEQPLPFSDRLTVTLSAGADETIYYTLNGTTPDRFGIRYNRPFTLNASEWGERGAVELRTVVYGKNGIPGKEKRVLLPYDTLAPAAPLVTSKPVGKGKQRIHIEKPEEKETEILYEISFNGEAEDPGISSPRGEETMILQVPEGVRERVELRFAVKDNAGNISNAEAPLIFDFRLLDPGPVEISRSADAIFCRASDGSIIEYQLLQLDPELLSADYRHEPDDNKWLRYSGMIPLESEAPLASFMMFAKAIGSDGNQGEVQSLGPIHIDKRQSLPVEVSGLPSDGVTREQVVLNIRTLPLTSYRYRFDISEDGETWSTMKEGTWHHHIIVAGEQNENRYYRLEIEPFSTVTGRSGEHTQVRFSIDKSKPELPFSDTLSGRPSFNRNITIALEGMEEKTRYWFLLEPENNGREESDYDEQLFLEKGTLIPEDGRLFLDFEGIQGVHFLRFFAADSLGNKSLSKDPIELSYHTRTPSSPELRVTGRSNGWLIEAFTDESGVRVEPAREWELPRTDAGIRFVAVDRVGNRSKPAAADVRDGLLFINGIAQDETGGDEKTAVSPEKEISPIDAPIDIPAFDTLISGLPRHFWTPESVTIRPEGDAVIRYELALGTEARDVSSRSDILDRPVTIAAEEGEAFFVSLNVALMARLGGKERVVASRRYRFGIDKNPPEPPRVVGVENGVFYRDNRRIRIFSDESEVQSIRYRITREASESAAETDFRTYNSEFPVTAVGGTFSDYLLETYAIDEAGNRSETREIRFAIDKAVLYVFPRAEEEGDGSRARPFRSLSRALADAEAHGMSTIILSSGQHLLDTTMKLEGRELSIEGGYSWPDWQKSSGLTAITTDKSFGDSPLFQVEDSQFTIKDLSIDNLVSRGPILRQRKGMVLLDSVQLYQAVSSLDAAIVSSGGKISLNNSAVRFGPLYSGKLLSIVEGTLLLSGSTMEGSGKSVQSTLINAENSRVTIDKSSITPGESDRLITVSVSGGSLTVIDSTIHTGNNDSRATACLLKNSDFYLLDSTLISGKGGRLAFLVDTIGSKVALERSLFLSDGNEGSIQIRSSKSTLSVQESVFAGNGEGRGFLYGIQSDNSSLMIRNSIFYYTNNADTIAVDLKKSSLEVSAASFVLPAEGAWLAYALRSDSPENIGIGESYFYSSRRANSAYFNSPALTALAESRNNRFLELPQSIQATEDERVLFDLYQSKNGNFGEELLHPVFVYPELYRRLLGVDPVKQ